MNERTILHCDINHCYAQIEEMMHPELRDVPMAVGGHEEYRHGIILAKNDLAKKYKVKTAESLREALVKCPNLVIIHPDYELYLYITEKIKDIYREYSDKVESFGIDEAWVDVSDSIKLFGSGYEIAQRIQNRVLREYGISVSIGISFNKIFAKFGSDLFKPLGLVEITHDNFKQVVWPRPVDELLYVGRATSAKLQAYGIMKIEDLATASPEFLKRLLGKMGLLIYQFANGGDISEVALNGYRTPVKSVGNGITTPKDIKSYEDAKMVFWVLAESISSRLRDQGLVAKVISINVRNSELSGFSRQCIMRQSIDTAAALMPYALKLLKDNYDFKIPLRSVTLTLSHLEMKGTATQLDLFGDTQNNLKNETIERTMDKIRSRFGFYSIKRCSLLVDEELSTFNPKGEHNIHPVGFL